MHALSNSMCQTWSCQPGINVGSEIKQVSLGTLLSGEDRSNELHSVRLDEQCMETTREWQGDYRWLERWTPVWCEEVWLQRLESGRYRIRKVKYEPWTGDSLGCTSLLGRTSGGNLGVHWEGSSSSTWGFWGSLKCYEIMTFCDWYLGKVTFNRHWKKDCMMQGWR